VSRQAAEHAQTQHSVQVIPEVAVQVRRQLRNEDTQEENSSTREHGWP